MFNWFYRLIGMRVVHRQEFGRRGVTLVLSVEAWTYDRVARQEFERVAGQLTQDGWGRLERIYL